MIPHVVRDRIQRAVVGVRFVAGIENVMLCDEVSRDGMNGKTEEGAEDEIREAFATEEVEHGAIEG